MNKKTMPSYQDLVTALSHTALKPHPSQAHGLISGVLCGNPKTTAAWEELITGGQDPAKTHTILQALFDTTAKELDEFLFEFELVMPPEADDLPARAEALTLWCQGFLTGLKLAQVQIVGRTPGDVTEAINDMIEIAKMNYEDVVADEEDEQAYVELVEYVRMAAILIYQDRREQETAKGTSTTTTSNHLH